MKISIFGTGYVGLVVGACLAENGNRVIAVDVDEDKIARLKRGEIPIYEPGLSELVARNVAEERLSFTTDFDRAVVSSKILFVAVGTPQGEDGSADMSHVLAVAKGIARAMNERKIVVLKSTVPVGTNRKVKETIASATEYSVGVVSNPEFLKEGAAIDDFLRPDRVVIGAEEPETAEVMEELYRPFVRTGNPILVMDPESAELTKYAANAMLASLCEKVGADVSQVRRAVGSDRRIGHAFLFPGVGYGGSCFPKDIRALVRMAEELGVEPRVMRAVDEVNERQKGVAIENIQPHFRGELRGKTIAVWGLAFKPRTDDIREAPALVLIEWLLSQGAVVRVHDPEALEKVRRQYGERLIYCAKPM